MLASYEENQLISICAAIGGFEVNDAGDNVYVPGDEAAGTFGWVYNEKIASATSEDS